MRLFTGKEIVWRPNVQMGQRKRLQRGVRHYRYQCVVNNNQKTALEMYACDYLFYCLSIYLKRMLLLLYIDNINTLSENTKFICTSVSKSDRKAFLSYFAASANEFDIFRQWTYIVFILKYHKIKKKQKTSQIV